MLGPNLIKKSIFGQNEKSEHHHWILDIWISLSTKFSLKLEMFIFWIKFTPKGYFRLKMGKVNISVEFCISDLVYNNSQNIWE